MIYRGLWIGRDGYFDQSKSYTIYRNLNDNMGQEQTSEKACSHVIIEVGHRVQIFGIAFKSHHLRANSIENEYSSHRFNNAHRE